MTTAAVFGCTGQSGSQILATLLTSDAFSSVKTISRRLPNVQSSKLQALHEVDTSKWGGMISSLSPRPSVVFNAVGTQRSKAGSLNNQWKIDHDLCIENAKAAKDAGVTTYVFISVDVPSSFLSMFVPFWKMKLGVENAIKELEFEHAIIVRPGMLIGNEEPKAPFLEHYIFGQLNKLGQGIQDRLAQHEAVVGRAVVSAARMAEEGKAPSKYWILKPLEIVKLGRDEWKE
ncbi:NAD dependent epimerase/dehydratase family protein [Paracoccidioides lutzii Pb01]|uniref:NAD dependent epimerase/dehydratase family protein n=1 Tax=Paracoccidioides lutzii (strain ATCC MYA-826 / Pb01) TaxID=502779 RepID=C1H1W7_PARBA|nr:NAD dependent epimerase/dehydratase family protein [Paracoccidioides lutzii Pb01]EEH33854.1 NAD dependent epimerase/dehydratase family protein [Paracoccidioides lutzii Pb01]